MEGVIAVQFEDITSQMMNRILGKNSALCDFFHHFMELHNDRNEINGIQRFSKRIDGMQGLLNAASATSKNTDHCHAADVELF